VDSWLSAPSLCLYHMPTICQHSQHLPS
jgi:hypothetical protein